MKKYPFTAFDFLKMQDILQIILISDNWKLIYIALKVLFTLNTNNEKVLSKFLETKKNK